MTDQEAAERYATGNHRSSFPDTFEMKAFLAGCARKESQLLARISRLREALERAAAALTPNWRDKNASPHPLVAYIEAALSADEEGK